MACTIAGILILIVFVLIIEAEPWDDFSDYDNDDAWDNSFDLDELD